MAWNNPPIPPIPPIPSIEIVSNIGILKNQGNSGQHNMGDMVLDASDNQYYIRTGNGADADWVSISNTNEPRLVHAKLTLNGDLAGIMTGVIPAHDQLKFYRSSNIEGAFDTLTMIGVTKEEYGTMRALEVAPEYQVSWVDGGTVYLEEK